MKKFSLPPSTLQFATSCLQSPANTGREITHRETGPNTASLPTASPAAKVIGMLSPAWAKKAVKEFASPKKYSLHMDPATCLVEPERAKTLLQNLKLDKKDIAKGHFGSISIFKNQNGEKLVGKFFNPAPGDKDGLSEEEFFKEVTAFKAIYEAVGRHPNLVNMHGIAKMPGKSGKPERSVLLMDAVPGPTGTKLFDALRSSWDAGKISSSEYWGAMQFIGKRLLDVTEHMGKAEVVHNDIKPDNFLVNEHTGEPVLIDLGGWCWKGDIALGITESYAAPEAKIALGVDEKSDVFSAGASLLQGIEGGEIKSDKDMPSRGLRHEPELRKDKDGNIVREPKTYAAKTTYTDFMNQVMAHMPSSRLDAKDAKDHPFLNDTLLDDEAAKKVIKDVISTTKAEGKSEKGKGKLPKSSHNAYDNHLFKQAQKDLEFASGKPSSLPARLYKAMGISEGQALIQSCFMSLKKNPSLHLYARLQSFEESHPETREYLKKKKNELAKLEQQVIKTAEMNAIAYITYADWFAPAKSILDTVPTTPVKSDVDQNGVRRSAQGNDINADAVNKAKMELSSYVDQRTLKSYVNSAEKFLYDASALKNTGNQEINDKLAQVRERATLARRMLEIFEMDSSSSEAKPRKSPSDAYLKARDELQETLKMRR